MRCSPVVSYCPTRTTASASRSRAPESRGGAPRLRALVPGCAILFALACDPYGGGLEPRAFLEQYTAAYCASPERCCEAPPLGSEEECVSITVGSLERIIASVEEGRAAWDGRAAQACVRSVETRPCGARRTVDCSGVVIGLLAPGERCDPTRAWECASGSCQAGECVALAAAGEPCDTGATVCEPGLVCHSLDFVCRVPGDASAPCGVRTDCREGLLCAEGACAPRAREGEPCIFDVMCADGLFCNADGVCEAQRAAGEECRDHGWCRPDLVCVGSVCASSCGSP